MSVLYKVCFTKSHTFFHLHYLFHTIWTSCSCSGTELVEVSMMLSLVPREAFIKPKSQHTGYILQCRMKSQLSTGKSPHAIFPKFPTLREYALFLTLHQLHGWETLHHLDHAHCLGIKITLECDFTFSTPPPPPLTTLSGPQPGSSPCWTPFPKSPSAHHSGWSP